MFAKITSYGFIANEHAYLKVRIQPSRPSNTLCPQLSPGVSPSAPADMRGSTVGLLPQDAWCQLDFVVVSLAWLPILFPDLGNYSVVRSVRALVPPPALEPAGC